MVCVVWPRANPPTPGIMAAVLSNEMGPIIKVRSWGWLLGPFATAHYQVYGDATLTRSYLTGLEHHLFDGCLGSISEIFDGDPPHDPRGCFAQAWSVAEVLRAWREIK